ncbi:MAG: hypothetical protein WED09_06590 [Homoserinimonas sp.]
MARTTTPQVVRSYLAELDNALASVPAEVRDEIVAGTREELDGLDSVAAAARIESLGDPEFIAAEARAEAGRGPSIAGVAEASAEPRWYPVLGALLVAFGGVFIPVIGWIAGLALMWTSKTWRLRDKWIATLTPFVAVGLVVLVLALTTMASPSIGPSVRDFGNPVIPGVFSAVWSSAVLIIPVNAVVGIWLLWRAKRTWSPDGPPRAVPASTATRRPQASWYPPVTVLLIIGGGFVVPVVGWVAGVTMLWAAEVWGRRDKWLGTLAGPIALLVSGVFWLGSLFWIRTTAGAVDPFLLVTLSAIVLPTIANVLVGIRLLRRRDPTQAQAAE